MVDVMRYQKTNGEVVPQLYVSTKPGWPNSPEGAGGYLIVPLDETPDDYWTKNYRIRLLSGNIYCYELSSS